MNSATSFFRIRNFGNITGIHRLNDKRPVTGSSRNQRLPLARNHKGFISKIARNVRRRRCDNTAFTAYRDSTFKIVSRRLLAKYHTRILFCDIRHVIIRVTFLDLPGDVRDVFSARTYFCCPKLFFQVPGATTREKYQIQAYKTSFGNVQYKSYPIVDRWYYGKIRFLVPTPS